MHEVADPAVKERLQGFIREGNWDFKHLAEASGIARTTLYAYMADRYRWNKALEKKITAFLDDYEHKNRKGSENIIIEHSKQGPEENNKKLSKLLKELMKMKNISANNVAKAIGISSAALSQWMNQKYIGDSEKINESVKAYLTRQKEIVQLAKKDVAFVDTTVSRKVFEVARLCHLEGEIGVVYGPAGVGKTEAVKEYVKRNPGTVLIEADLGHTARLLFEDITDALGISDGYNRVTTLGKMVKDTVNTMKGTGRMIIVDEAEMLPYKALELIRRINDKAGAGILLSGMPRLISNIRGRKGEYAQLYSRIGYAVQLEPLTLEDTFELVKQLIPNGESLFAAYHSHSYGNTRTLTKLLYRSIRVAQLNKIEIDEEVIEKTAKILIRK